MLRHLLLAVLIAGCIDDLELQTVMLTADAERFAAEVQPILAQRCANPSCHGSADRPLELFAVHQHRLDPTDVYRDDPLTEQELSANFTRSCGFMIDLDRAMDCLLVRKPLARGAGGMGHAGGVQYSGLDEPELQVVIHWIQDAFEEAR